MPAMMLKHPYVCRSSERPPNRYVWMTTFKNQHDQSVLEVMSENDPGVKVGDTYYLELTARPAYATK